MSEHPSTPAASSIVTVAVSAPNERAITSVNAPALLLIDFDELSGNSFAREFA